MSGEPAVDVLIVSLGSTGGLRSADEQLADSLARAGASVAVAAATAPREVRTLALTDLGWALAARRAAAAELSRRPARAVVYSSTTAALLWSRPGAIRFDAPAAANRPGRHGVWQRPLERRRLRQAALLVPWSEGGLAEAGTAARGRPAVVVPVAVAPSGPPQPERDLAALCYTANPEKKGLDRILLAWARARRPDEQLFLAGADLSLRQEGVCVLGRLPAGEYRALLRRTRVFVSAPRREDHGLAQLEALADGCRLVTTEAPGPYVALALARQLDARLVGEDLAGAMRLALDDPLPGYAARALELLAPLAPDEVDRRVAQDLLPALLAAPA